MHEIERKFLVHPQDVPDVKGRLVVQGYLSAAKERTVRIRIRPPEAWITVKGPSVGITRHEFEYPIPLAHAEAMLPLCETPAIRKIRREITVGDHVIEVDTFLDRNLGLVVAEIELDDETEAYPHPEWLGPEVSHDHRLTNSALSLRPFLSWTADERENLRAQAFGLKL